MFFWYISLILVDLNFVSNEDLLCNTNGTTLSTTATLTCDGEKMYVFVDGEQHSKPKFNGYQTVQKYVIPPGSKILAISCSKENLTSRILGDIGHVSLTGSKGWRCTRDYDHNWHSLSFNDSSWPSAVAFKQNSQLPYEKVANISLEAKWIGTDDQLAANKTLYCRFMLKCPAKISGNNLPKTCSVFSSKRVDDHKLTNHVFSSLYIRSIIECAQNCFSNRCLSFNYIEIPGEEEQLCELNDMNHTGDPKHFIHFPGVIYYYKEEN